jgi:hypothetical protein
VGCNCSKNRNRTATNGTPVPAGTYRVMVKGRKVYESASSAAAKTVAERFTDARVLAPGQDA